MTFYYSHDSDKIIVEHEEKTFAKYLEIIKGYTPTFAKHTCDLEVRRVWIPYQRIPFEAIESDSRLPFNAGYACYVCCDVKRNGKIVRYDAKDGEADYYDLSMSWQISSISRFLRLKVTLFASIEDVIETMDHFGGIIASSSVEFIT